MRWVRIAGACLAVLFVAAVCSSVQDDPPPPAPPAPLLVTTLPTPTSTPATTLRTATRTTTTRSRATTAPEVDAPERQAVSYRSCAEARAAGAAPLHRGDPGYSSRLDRDGDGVACESN